MTLGGFLIAHGSALILPLSVIEGPFVTIVTGLLTAQGYFDWYWAVPLLVCGDLIGDLIYYWIGRTPLTSLNRRFGLARRSGLTNTLTPAFQNHLRQNATRMLLVGKWTHSIGCAVLIGSGMLRIPLPRFLLVNLIGTLPKTGVLFGVGYFAGDHLPWLERHAELAIAALCLAGVAAIGWLLWRAEAIRTGR